MLNKQDFFGFKNIFAIPICQDGKRMVMKWSRIALYPSHCNRENCTYIYISLLTPILMQPIFKLKNIRKFPLPFENNLKLTTIQNAFQRFT